VKSLIAYVAAALLVLTMVEQSPWSSLDILAAIITPVRNYAEGLLFRYFLLITLTVICAVITAVASPRASLTRAVFCGLSMVFGLFGLLKAPQFLLVLPD
jgi:hypothetical protein